MLTAVATSQRRVDLPHARTRTRTHKHTHFYCPQHFDADGSGYITKEELEEALQQHGDTKEHIQKILVRSEGGARAAVFGADLCYETTSFTDAATALSQPAGQQLTRNAHPVSVNAHNPTSTCRQSTPTTPKAEVDKDKDGCFDYEEL